MKVIEHMRHTELLLIFKKIVVFLKFNQSNYLNLINLILQKSQCSYNCILEMFLFKGKECTNPPHINKNNLWLLKLNFITNLKFFWKFCVNNIWITSMLFLTFTFITTSNAEDFLFLQLLPLFHYLAWSMLWL